MKYVQTYGNTRADGQIFFWSPYSAGVMLCYWEQNIFQIMKNKLEVYRLDIAE